jgi:hypothetical protein
LRKGWVRLPRADTEALERREITLQDFGLAAFIRAKVDHRTGSYIATLGDLQGASGFPGKTTENLRQRLGLLKKAGLTCFDDPKPGQRAPWIFRHPVAPEPPNDLRVTSKLAAPSQLEVTAKDKTPEHDVSPHQESDLPSPTLQPPLAREKEEEEIRRVCALSVSELGAADGGTEARDAARSQRSERETEGVAPPRTSDHLVQTQGSGAAVALCDECGEELCVMRLGTYNLGRSCLARRRAALGKAT